MTKHPTSDELRARLHGDDTIDVWADDALAALAACEAERDRYLAFIQEYIEWANDSHPMAWAAVAALRGK